MTDRYQQFAGSPVGRQVIRRLGLPNPVPLRRYEPGQPLLNGPALVGAAPAGRLAETVAGILRKADADVRTATDLPAGTDEAPTRPPRYGALIFDATGITEPARLRELHDFFQPVIRSLTNSARVLVLGTPPDRTGSVDERVAQRALEGFTRSVGKELKRGATVQLGYVAPGAEPNLESTLRFLLSAKSAYVSGQVVTVSETAQPAPAPESWATPLAGQVALVTGAARGIGAAIATVLARDGAHVICVDVPAQGADLSALANRIGGAALQLDITGDHAGDRIAEHARTRHDGLDIVVHNAGITRDKTLANMDAAKWDAVLAVNLASQLRINEVLLGGNVLRAGGRLIGVSSIAGISGNVGQTNYAASKAGVIGMVQALAPTMTERGGTINAVAPGFIETKMTAAVPLFVREAGRRMNGMAQGGLPLDVAETIAWFANPASTGVNGTVLRVCGQSLLGA
ncbi:MAG TPA: 3-oxoacyl-ACP reductase [Pseudonocardiaceae bacterium]|jgi:3-oxoacyl-[acyl-carrier protein] reductase|nr:3-oxoacyl-ACP reductase [Pseudonocardiaceae bacterium]